MTGGKHTKGPWWYDAANNAVYDTASNVIIVYEGQLQFKSDGPLIAAAPDLLDALKQFRAKVYNAALGSGMDDEWATVACSVADAAIANAEGGAA